jgi:uncharacterized protein (TIGR02680 family)
MNRAGIVDVWYYYDTEFDLSGGRLVLRGTNGSGKSRALELLLPFVLDADRRKMDATGSAKVSLVELMKAGAEDRTIRAGYLWLELARTVDPTDPADAGLHSAGVTEHFLTVGAHIRFSRSTGEAKVHYFTTDLRVGADLHLLSPTRETLPREKLAELIGADRITTSPGAHRDRVRSAVFTLTGDSGAERYSGLLQLLHTLRSPDVGNRIEEGKLPQILSDALPPLNEVALNAAGEQLDGLSETRAAQGRLEAALGHVNAFLGSYRRYAATAVAGAATAASKAATDAETATKDAHNRAGERARLEAEHGEKSARMSELTETIAELDATITGIKQSAAYADARDLDERERKVEALSSAADTALRSADHARMAEARDVAAANEAAATTVAEARRAAAALEAARGALEKAGASGVLPATIDATITSGHTVTEPVRRTREGDPTAFDRPVPDELVVVPNDLDLAGEQLTRVRGGIDERGRQAAGRLAEARALETQRAKVEEAERHADDADERARDAEAIAVERQSELEQVAVAYAERWREWCADDKTVAAFGTSPDVADTPLTTVLDDSAWLVVDLTDDELTDLDRVAEALAAPARDTHIRCIAELDTADDDAASARADLLAEQGQLRSAIDPSPARPAWLSPVMVDAVPLRRTIDFGDGLDDQERAGLEGALLASGLLLATLHDDGSLRAENGQLLLTPTGPIDAQPVVGKLVPDPASPVPTELVEAVLSRVGYRGNPEHSGNPSRAEQPDRHRSVWVAADGSWGSGPLRGRHMPATARHIGAAAREEARRTRLAAIEAELDELAAAERVRADARAKARAAIAQLEAVVRDAPRTQTIASARVRATDAAGRAATERSAAHAAATAAAQGRTAWARASGEHRTICSEFGLPHTVEELDRVRQATAVAGSACGRVSDLLDGLNERLAGRSRAVDSVADRATERRQAEEHAAVEWTLWHREASELESVRESVGRDAAAARAELRKCEKSHRGLTAELEQVRIDVSGLGLKVGAAKVEARNAADRVTATQTALHDVLDHLRRRVSLPGVAAAAFADAPEPIELLEVAPAAVRALATRLMAGLRRHGDELDENALIRPLQTLERELSGTFDVIVEVHDGVRLVELSDAAGRRTAADAAAELTRLVDQGRDALSERERQVFTEFVLGGVAEELRRRLDQAEKLIDAMNTSLATIRTSHGIGVKLRWRIAESSGPAIVRIKELVSTAGAVRSAEHTAELTELLKTRVDEAFALDESAGYATHLHEALDYRSWHAVEVIILGPKPNQERRISRKARLSQGETRFVSYVTLFAAIDAYLSGLPDTGRALRLLLLDDAFAKVDDRTIGEFMGLLVRLDVDFAMTGHALWGTYPQVPALDCYEVRRVEGSAAVTTHVHWDGHTRHLRAAR